MRIVAISDLHGWLPPDVPACDLLIIAGDVCPDVPATGFRARLAEAAEDQARWLRETFAPWIDRQPAKDVVMCWGNHDYVGEAPELVPSLPVQVLTDAETSVQGCRLYATPWTSFLPDVWAFDVPRVRLDDHMDRIPDGIDILITHGPPFGVLDRVNAGVLTGSEALLEAVARVRPRIHVFGHIHECRGQRGTSYNVAVLDERYEPYDKPVVVIEIP